MRLLRQSSVRYIPSYRTPIYTLSLDCSSLFCLILRVLSHKYAHKRETLAGVKGVSFSSKHYRQNKQ